MKAGDIYTDKQAERKKELEELKKLQTVKKTIKQIQLKPRAGKRKKTIRRRKLFI